MPLSPAVRNTLTLFAGILLAIILMLTLSAADKWRKAPEQQPPALEEYSQLEAKVSGGEIWRGKCNGRSYFILPVSVKQAESVIDAGDPYRGLVASYHSAPDDFVLDECVRVQVVYRQDSEDYIFRIYTIPK